MATYYMYLYRSLWGRSNNFMHQRSRHEVPGVGTLQVGNRQQQSEVNRFPLAQMGSAVQLGLLLLVGIAQFTVSRSASTHANAFKPGTRFDLRVYVTESKERYDAFDNADLVWHEKGLEYCEACGDREKEVSHTASRKLLTHNPARAVAHVFVTKQGYFPGSKKHAKKRGLKYSKLATSYKRVSLVRKGDRRKSE